MALAPINPTQLTPPRVALIDQRSGAISREWYRFFLSLLTATETNQQETELAPDTGALLASYDAMLASVAQASETASDGMVASLESSLISLQNAFGVTPPDLGGTVTSVAASGGATGLTFTGSPITTSGTLTLGGTLAVASGGTGQTSYTDGQLLIGNSTGNTLTKATLIAGTNISITNGAGSITINASETFTGTVTSVSVVSANGLAGTVANATTTPAITLSTTVTGIVKGNGTALSAASAGTDYVVPGAITGSGLTMATARLLGRTTASTGAVEEISVAGGLTLSGGVLTGASGTVTSVTGTSPVVSSGGTTPAISMPAATASVDGYLTSTDWTTFNNKGSGSVTSVSVVSANGLAGTVANATTTPAITLSTTVTGLVKGNGTALSAAVAATDYVAPSAYASANGLTMATARLLGRTTAGTGAAEEISVAGGLTLSGGVLTGASGTVTSVTGTAPVVSSGGTTPAISMAAATASVNGYLTSTDWTTFNGKQAALVSGTNIKTVGGVSLLGSGDVGTIGVAYGGTGAATLTSGYLLKGNGTSAVSASVIYDDGSSVGIGTTSLSARFSVNGGTGTSQTRFEVSTTEVQEVVTDAAQSAYANRITDAAQQIWEISGTERMRVNSSGNVGVGTSSPAGILETSSSSDGSIFASTYVGSGVGASFIGRKARGSQSSPSGILSGDTLSQILARGYTSAGAFSGNVGAVAITAAENFTSTANGTNITFATTATGATGRTERMRIDSSGNVGVGATANASAILDVQSTTKGFRLPNMTTVEKNAIAAPAAGLMVFDTTLAKACVYSGAAWQTITSL